MKGLEKALEDRLRARPGVSIFTVGPDGKRKRTIAERPPRNGETIRLTIDVRIQKQIHEKIKKEKGAAVVLHLKTGDILAAVSAPSFDPNLFIQGMTAEEWKRLNNPSKPLLSRFQHTYTPGSTMKPLTAAIGLETGAVTPDTVFDTSAGRWQKDSSWGDHYVTRVPNPGGGVDLREAMAWSDNIYFARTGLRIGIRETENRLKRWGFGKPIPLPLPFEPSQIANSGHIAGEIQLADSSYGQGQLQISPLHLGLAYTPFVNGGNLLKPRLIMEDEPTKAEVWEKQIISPQTADTVRGLLEAVVTDPHGTARDLSLPGVRLAAKTGTTELKASKEEKNGRQLGWLVVIAGRSEPDRLITVMMEDVENRGGSHALIQPVKQWLKEQYSKKSP